MRRSVLEQRVRRRVAKLGRICQRWWGVDSYFVWDHSGAVFQAELSLEELGRELGVLKEDETLWYS